MMVVVVVGKTLSYSSYSITLSFVADHNVHIFSPMPLPFSRALLIFASKTAQQL